MLCKAFSLQTCRSALNYCSYKKYSISDDLWEYFGTQIACQQFYRFTSEVTDSLAISPNLAVYPPLINFCELINSAQDNTLISGFKN